MGDLIRKLRKNKDLTQMDLANILGISQQAVGHYESGLSTPKIKIFLKIMDLFKKNGFKIDEYKLLKSLYR